MTSDERREPGGELRLTLVRPKDDTDEALTEMAVALWEHIKGRKSTPEELEECRRGIKARAKSKE